MVWEGGENAYAAVFNLKRRVPFQIWDWQMESEKENVA